MNCSKHQNPITFICSHDDCYNLYCRVCMKDHTQKTHHKDSVLINAKSKEVFHSWNTYILPKINEIIAYVIHKGSYEILSTDHGQEKIIMCNSQVAEILAQVLLEQAHTIEKNIQLLESFNKNASYDKTFLQSMARIFTKSAIQLGNIITQTIQKRLQHNYPKNLQYKKLKLHLKQKVIDTMRIFKEKIISDFQSSILNQHLVDRLFVDQSRILKLCKSQISFPSLKNFKKNQPQQSNSLGSLASMAKHVKEQIILSPDSYAKTPKASQSKSMFIAQLNEMTKSFDDGQKSTTSRKKINCKYITQQHLKHLSMENLFEDSQEKQSLEEKQIKRLRVEINGLRHENQEKDKQIEDMKKTFELARTEFERLQELFSLSKLNGQKFESLYKLLSLHSSLENKSGPLDTHIKEKVWKLKSQLLEEKQKQEHSIDKLNFNSITKFVNKKYIDNLKKSPNQKIDLEPQRCSLTERENKKLKAQVYVLKTQIHNREKQLKKQILKNNELTKIINKLQQEDDKIGQKIQDLGNKTSQAIGKKTLTLKNFCELQRDHLENQVKVDQLKARLKQRQMKIKHYQNQILQFKETINNQRQIINNIENTILKYTPKGIKPQKIDANGLLCQQLETILKRKKSRTALKEVDKIPSINIIRNC